jgi:hypothetical protein
MIAQVQSELQLIKTTEAWKKIEKFLERRLKKYGDISIINLDKVVVHELYYARGVSDIIKRILNFIRNIEMLPVKDDKEKEDGK